MAVGPAKPQGVWAKWGGYNVNNVNAISKRRSGVSPTAEQQLPSFEKEKGALVDAASKPRADSTTLLTMEEVAKHSTLDDCWIIINDKVYDVTEFGKTHPGGPVIFTQAGRDATDYFRVFHSSEAWTYLPQSLVGDLQNPEPMSELLTDYRELRRVLLKAQLFKSNKFYYWSKSLVNFCILALSLWIMSASNTFLAVLCSAFVFGLFLQQCGWLSHDFLHHQVSEDRWFNTCVGGLFWGNFIQGYSMGWWKTKHNVHHAATNECDEAYNPVDPDIDTLPLLAWSKDILATVDDQYFRSIIKIQHILFFPLLFFARFTWLHSSWMHASHFEMPKAMRFMERGCLILHHLSVISLAFWFLPAPMALTWIFFSQLFCGALLSYVFVISHNGMDVYNDSRDFFTAQVTSTRNIQGNLFNDWFTGGLNRQIEHHLFPSLPRHNLKKVSPYVKALCLKHGLRYEELSLLGGISSVFIRLLEVAHAV